MKKEFSFYEFVGILVPGVTLLFFSEVIVELVYKKTIIDFSKVGESVVFLIIAYGIGHILQAVGNLFETLMWELLFGGRPSHWLTKKNRFGLTLFDPEQEQKIKTKIFQQFGETKNKDYGKDIHNWLSLKEKITEKRIDVFNANYSLFRGLTVSFYLLTIIVLILLGWKLILIPLVLGLLSNFRMFRFGKLFATEVFRTYLYLD
jgi:hypothetical protein